MIDEHGVKNFLWNLVPGQEPNVDIVAVHGLNPKNKANHAETTWESGGKIWLRDFLPKKLPHSRIFLYGYNSNVGIQSSAAGVREQAQNLLNRLWLERQGCESRPILFIAHSLGGIVVKECPSTLCNLVVDVLKSGALVQARLGTAYYSICTATFGIVFFSTPHRGSQLAQVGEIFARVVRAVLRNPGNTFLRALKKDDLYANELSSNFSQLLENYRYLNFFETLPLKSFGLIVEKDSAVLGLPDSREQTVALDADHEEICKFASEEDEDYQHVSELIVEFVESTTKPRKEHSIVKSFNSDTTLMDDWIGPSYFVLPYQRNIGFIDRKPIIKQLKECIIPIGKSHSRVSLFGLGGVGKSQIAIELAYQIHTEFPEVSVFWVHASNIDRFREGYYNIVKECGISGREDEKSDKMTLLKEWLEKEHKNWLFIIDNVDEASLLASKGKFSSQSKTGSEPSILGYLPDSPHGSILITTRNRAAGLNFTINCSSDPIEVNTMTDEESSCLIKAALHGLNPTDSEMQELASLLSKLPLALAQAAAFMQENMLPVNEYIELYNDSEETQMELLSEPFEALGRDSGVPNAVAATLIVSINQIKVRDPKAIEILCLVSFVDQHNIPKSLIQGKVKRPLELAKSLGTLKSFSLVNANERGNFSLHRLVQLVMRKWMIIESKFEDQAIQAMDVVAELLPNATFERWPVCAAYLPHAQSILIFVPDLQGTLLRRRLYLQEGIAYYLWTQGYYHEAEKLDLLIVEENKKEFGMEHPETLESIEALASTCESQGKWSEAAKLDQHVIEIREKSLGPIHPLTLTSKSNLTSAYNGQGRLAEAESLMLEVLETHKSLSGANHEDTIDAIANLGFVYVEMRQPKKAEELIREAWEWRKEDLGSDHKVTLGTASTLGFVYKTQGRLQEAERLISDTIRTQITTLGSAHPSTLDTQGTLISIYQKNQEWEKAEELALEVIGKLSERVGSKHYNTLVEKSKLADIYFNQGSVDLADTLRDAVLWDAIGNLGQNHPFVLDCMQETAITQRHQSRTTEGIDLMVQVVSRRERVLGPFHDDTLISLQTLCDWCGKDEAIEMLLEEQSWL